MKEERHPWAMLIVLVAAAILSFLDRQLIGLLVDPIKRDLRIDDFQVGLLGGPAFAVFFALAGLPLGWLADRVDRGRLISAGVALWSAATALTAFAGSFAHLFFARMGVGVGEATLGPSAHALIGERFAGPRLPLAMSIYSTGVSLGAGLAFALGGQIVSLASSPMLAIPVVQGLANWQRAFLIVGTPGLLMAAIIALTVRDVPRRAAHGAGRGLRTYYRLRKRLVWLHITGVGLLSAVGYANLLWFPSVVIRRFGWRPQEIGGVVGLLLMTLGVAGALGAGLVATSLTRRGRADAPIVVIAAAASLSVPFALATLMPTAAATLALFAVGLLVSSAFVALGPAAVQAVTPAALRGRVAAIALMVTSLIGMIAGPVGVGAVTSFVFGDPARVGSSLALVTLTLTITAAACLWSARSPFVAALAAPDTLDGLGASAE